MPQQDKQLALSREEASPWIDKHYHAVAQAVNFAAAVVLAGCSATPKPCAPEDLARIELEFLVEASEACHGQTYETCVELPTIREKYRTKREKWIQCQ